MKIFLLLCILICVLILLEMQKVTEGFSFSEVFPTMSYVIYITFMFGFFGPLVWLGFLF
jgi:hypothetical protein